MLTSLKYLNRNKTEMEIAQVLLTDAPALISPPPE
jgi:hypothetical protein